MKRIVLFIIGLMIFHFGYAQNLKFMGVELGIDKNLFEKQLKEKHPEFYKNEKGEYVGDFWKFIDNTIYIDVDKDNNVRKVFVRNISTSVFIQEIKDLGKAFVEKYGDCRLIQNDDTMEEIRWRPANGMIEIINWRYGINMTNIIYYDENEAREIEAKEKKEQKSLLDDI